MAPTTGCCGGGGGDFVAKTGDTLLGGGGDDNLEAGGYYAILNGGAGDDILGLRRSYFWDDGDHTTLIGGKGQDALYSRLRQHVVLGSLKDSTLARPDHVFMHGSPFGVNVDLHGIDADTTQAGDQAFTLITGKFTGEAGELRVFLTTGTDGLAETWVLMDVDGDARADAMIVLEGDHKGFDDFVL